MKLTPTLRRHPNALVVTIDDDTAYGPDSVFKLLRAQRLINYEGVVSFEGFQSRPGVNFRARSKTKARAKELLPRLQVKFPHAKVVDVAEGFSMVMYPS
jgi:GT2 family glycosyltransferase